METLGSLFVVFLLVLPFALYVWAFLRRQRREHQEILSRSAERTQELAENETAHELSAFWLAIREAFPYLEDLKPASVSAEAILRSIAERLIDLPRIGTFGEVSLPVPALPEVERRRHLYIVGKTGSGKSTFLEHLITADIALGRGVAVLSPEGELFQRLLSLVPDEREKDVVYFAPGNPDCPLTWNPLAVLPGEDAARAAEDLFTIFRHSLSDDSLGPRMQPILQNAFAALVGRPGRTLWDVKRLLEDPAFREEAAVEIEDPYVRSFWLLAYPRFPKGADLPVLNRLDGFLRPLAVRRTIAVPESSFSIREILRERRIFFLDLSSLSEETRLLLGQMVLSKFGLELLSRERGAVDAEFFALYCDEFQAIAGLGEGLWRDLLSRGRKYGLGLTLAHQYPAQLSQTLRDEILGNVNSLVAFALGNKDAQVVRKELLVRSARDKKEGCLEPVLAEKLLELSLGEAYAKLAGGRALKFSTLPPLPSPGKEKAKDLVRESWRRYGAPPPSAKEPLPAKEESLREPETFLE